MQTRASALASLLRGIVRVLDRIVDLPVGPRRHPVVSALVIACAAGAGLSVWHSVAERVFANALGDAVLITFIVAAIEGIGVFLLALIIDWYLLLFPG